MTPPPIYATIPPSKHSTRTRSQTRMTTPATKTPTPTPTRSDFIRNQIASDLDAGRYDTVVTRFPPEPNGYPHVGHVKSICLNFDVAREFGGRCNLRMDDTNPETEDMEYVAALREATRWLGYNPDDRVLYASDYFEDFYRAALGLIRDGKAYVDSLNEEEIRAYRGTISEAGRPSPYRERAVEENLDLFQRMRKGDFADGEHVLRAKGDMRAPNMKMRDPLLYRIRHASHYRAGDDWPIYPMYDFAHPLSDAIEGITHSLCTLEFENNRDIYDWVVEHAGPHVVPNGTFQNGDRPRQYEFARLALNYTILSKRKLIQLVRDGHVHGWDDPRLPTIAGMRRRGVTPQALRDLCDRIGVSKANSIVDYGLLEACIRDDLNFVAPRVMAVLRPLKVTITNYPENKVEQIEASYWPRDVPKEGSRAVPFTRDLFIERDDFMETPAKRFFRLSPGEEVRLRYAYVIRCDEVIKDEAGEIVELRCTYDPDTLGQQPQGRKVQGTIHWVAAERAVPAEFRLHDRLLRIANPNEVDDEHWLDALNPDSLQVLHGYVEPSVVDDLRAVPSSGEGDVALSSAPNNNKARRYQFERQGYFWADPVDSSAENLVFNRIVSLRDSWATNGSAPASAAPRTPKPEPAPEEVVVGSRSESREAARAENPELATRYSEYIKRGLSSEEADILTGDLALALWFEFALESCDSPSAIANWIVNELLGTLPGGNLADELRDLPFSPQRFGALVQLLDEGTISSSAAKTVFAQMFETGDDPARIVKREGLQQVSDAGKLTPIIDEIMASNAGKVEAYRGGKTGLLGFFVGQVMRETRGAADPKVVNELVREKLDG